MSSRSGGRFWILLAVLLVGFCGASVWTLFELRRDSYAIATANARNLLAVLSQDIEGNLLAYDRVLSQVAAKLAGPEVAALDAPMQQAYLFDGVLVEPYFTSLLVLDAAGNVVRDAGAFPHRTDNFSDRDYFRAQRDASADRLFVSDPFRRRLTGDDEVVALSRRIEGPGGAFGGVIVGTVRLDYFLSLFRRAALHPRDSINLFSRTGVLLMRTPYRADQIGRDMSGSENVRRFMQEGSGTFSGTAAVDGVRRVYTFSPVGDLPLIMNVALDEEAIYADWRTSAVPIAGVLVLLCLVALAVSHRMRRELGRRARAERAALESETQYRLLADNATDIIIRLDHTLTRRYVSPACQRVLGFEPAELIGRRSRDLIHPDDWPVVERIVAASRRSGEPAEATYRLRHRSGRDVWVEGRYGHIPGENGYLVVLRDISKRKAAEAELDKAHAQLQDLANKDGLTGVANRRRFDEALGREWARAASEREPLSLLLLDVDHFKRFNDAYGHQAGDACLREVADAIVGCVRPGDVVARYGGEEFAVVLPGIDEDAARLVGERIRDAVRRLGIEHRGNPRAEGGPVVTLSIGCATNDPSLLFAPGSDEMLGQADAALYEAKRMGRDRVVTTSDMLADPKAGVGEREEEEERLLAVGRVRRDLTRARTDILNSVAREVAALMNAPIGFVSLVDRDDVHMIGRHGIDAQAVSRDVAFCSHTVAGSEPLAVPDLSKDVRFARNPLVADEGGLRFYAGTPFLDPTDGHRIGAVCAASDRPHDELTPEQRQSLATLGRIAAACLKGERD